MQFTPRQNCGSVMLQVVINAEGRVVPRATRVIRSNDASFADAFQNSLAAARFGPSVKDGVPVAMLDGIELGYSAAVMSGGTPPSAARAVAPRC